MSVRHGVISAGLTLAKKNEEEKKRHAAPVAAQPAVSAADIQRQAYADAAALLASRMREMQSAVRVKTPVYTPVTQDAMRKRGVSPSPWQMDPPFPSATPEMMDAMRKRDPGEPILSQPAGMQITEMRDPSGAVMTEKRNPMDIYSQYENGIPGFNGWDKMNYYDYAISQGANAQDVYAKRGQDYQDMVDLRGNLEWAENELVSHGNIKKNDKTLKNMRTHREQLDKQISALEWDMIDQNPDFAEVVSGVNLAWPEDFSYLKSDDQDQVFAAVVDPEGYKDAVFETLYAGHEYYPLEYTMAVNMSDAERNRYLYQYAKDPAKATEYFYALEPTIYQRKTQESNRLMYTYGQEHPVGATLLSIALSPFKSIGHLGTALDLLMGRETDPYGGNFSASHLSSSASGGARERVVSGFRDENGQDTIWSKAAGFGYDLVQNLGSNALNRLLGGGGLGTLLMMGSQSAGDSAMDAALRTDGDTQKAFLYGSLSGVVEIATEKIPLDKLEDMLSGKSKGLRALLALAFTEAPQEMAATAGQEVFDRIIIGAQSNYEINVRKLMAGDPENGIAPMDEASARKEATGLFLGEVIYSGLLGFGSGVVSGGGAQMKSRLFGNTHAAQQEAQKPAQEKTVKQKLDEAADAVIALREAEKPMPVEVEKTGDVLSFDQPMQAVRNTEEGGTAAPVQVAGIENGPDGKALLRVINESGTEERVGLDEVTLADEGMQDLLTDKAVQSMDAETLRGYLKDYNQDIATAPEYAKAYTGVYRRAATGMDYSTAVDGSEYAMRFLTAEAKRNAFEAGHAVSEAQPEKAKPKTTGGVVRAFSDAAWKSMDRSTRRRAAAQMEVLNAIGQRFGRSIRVVDSINADGKRANGMYNQNTGEITVALDADNNAYAYVGMHELTHPIRTEHPESWDTFSGFVRDALTAGGQDVDALVKYQMDRFGLNEADAWEEVVCNTVPAVLQDEAVLTDLYNRDRTLFERVMEWVKNLIDDIRKAGVTLSERSQSWKQMDALKDDRESLQKMYEAMKGILQSELAENSDTHHGTEQYSVSDSFAAEYDSWAKDKTQESTIQDGFVKMEGVKYGELIGSGNDGSIEQNAVEGVRPSVMEAPVNAAGDPIKYSLATYSEEMAKPFSVGRANAIGLEYEVQKIGARGKRTVVASGRDVTAALLKKEGHSQKTIENTLRFGDKIASWFDKAVGKYQFVNLQDINDATIMHDHNTGAIVFSCQVPNSEYKVNFDFTTVCRQREAVQRFIDDLAREKGKNGTKLEDISLTPQNIFKLNTILKNEGYETACLGCFVEAKRYRIKAQMDVLCDEWNELVRAKNPNAEYFGFATGETDLMKMSDDEVTKLEASMRAYNTKGTSKATDRAARLVELPEMQKLLRPSDFISRHGRQKIREFSPALESFLVSRFGQSGAKPAVGFMPYNSEIAALPDTKSVKGKRMSLQDYLAGLGGARSNSFSDYIPTHALDYIQRTLDMAARRLPAQCYTKVPGRARTFGTTGEKINMSVMFDIDPDVHWSSAGLDTAGEYIVGDKVRAEKVQKETGERPFVQSFPYEEAVEIEHDPRYAENCGIIGVGYSYNHIVKMQSDENIPYIIPYHRSNMPDSVAKASNTKHATNYEPVQNNTRVTGYAVVTNLDEANGVPSYATWPEGKKKTKSSSLTWDMEAALKRNDGNAKATIMEWLEWMQENNLSPMTSTAEAGHGKYDLYAQLEATGDLDATAEGYMKYCLENGLLPVFYEFVPFDNYDKHLFDFSVRNLHTGKVALQKPVSLDFVEKDGAEVFIDQIESDMSEYNEYNRDQFFSEKWGKVKETAYQELQEEEVKKFSLSDYDENVQESDKLLEEMLTMTAAHRMTDGEAMRIASRAKKAAQSKMDTKELAGKIKRVFDYAERSGRNKKLDMPGFNAELLNLAEELLATSNTLDTEHEKAVQPVRDYLRKAEIALTEEQRQEAVKLAGTYNDYRRQVFGRVKLRQNGQSLSDVWGELSRMNPEMFPTGASEREMVRDLVNAVDMMAPIYQDQSGMNEAENVQRVAAEIGNLYMSLSGVQKAAAEYQEFGMKLRDYRQVNERFTGEHKKLFKQAMAKVDKASKAEIAQKTTEAKLSAEAQAAEDMRAYRAAMQLKNLEWRETYRDKLKDTSRKQRYRAQITRMTNELLKRLEKPTDKKHVKAYLEEDLMAFLSSLDLGRRSKVTRSLGDRIRTLADRFTEAQSNSESGSGQYMIDPELIDRMRTMADEMASLDSMDKLNADQMRDMRDMVKAATHVVNAADYMFAMGKKIATSDVAERSMMEMSRKKNKKVRQGFAGKIDEMLSNGMLDSFRFFDRLGESAREVFTSIRSGFDRKVEKVSHAIDYLLLATEGFDEDLFRGNKAQKTTYKVSGGEITLTKAQVMELYCLSKRPQAQKHLYGGGIRTQDNAANAVTLNEADVQQICSSLTDEEVKMAEKLQSYLVKECAVWGNETSMTLYGYQKFTEENYYPIRVDRNKVQQMQTDKGQDENLYAILHMGMTKSTNDLANNALIVGDIFDTFSRHVDNMSTYNAYAAPIADMLRWYNWEPVDGGDGTKTMLEKKFGIAGRDYIPTLIRDLNGQVSKSYSPGIVEEMTRRAKSASVGFNIRVVVQQPTAIVRAADMMNPKYILKGLTVRPKEMRRAIDLAQRYCPIAKWKSLGFYETHIGKGLRTLMFGGQTALENLTDKSMALAGKMDEVTWGALWRACEAETHELRPDLTGAELYRETGKRLGEIIDYTQVVDTPLHRSQMMRSKNYVAQMSTAFMSEGTKTYNMLQAAIARWAENRKDPVARARVGRVLLVYAGTAALNAAAQSVWDAVRDSGTEEDFLEKILGKYVENLTDNLNPLGMIPVVSQVMDVLDGYDPSRMDMQAVQKVVQIGDQLKKVSEGKSNWTAAKWIQNVSNALSYMTGVPAGNLVRDLMAIYNTTSMALGGQPIAMTTSTSLSASTQKNLYDALESGNVKKWNRIVESLPDKDDAEIDGGVAKMLAEKDERVIRAYEAKVAGNGAETLRLRREMVDDLAANGILDEKRLTEIVDKAVLTYGASVNPDEKEDEPKSLNARLFKTEDGVNAVRSVANGSMSAADAKMVLSELVADSTAQDPEKSVRSTILAEVKKDWAAAVKAGDTKKVQSLEGAMTQVLGVTEEDIEKLHTDLNADMLREATSGGDTKKADRMVEELREAGLSDSDIKSRLSSFKDKYIGLVQSGDAEGADALKRMLMGLGLKGKNGNDLYTEETFAGWLD